MHALLLTLGSYGDVHPFLGLGAQLRARGHRVTLLTNDHFRSLAEAQGLGFEPIGSAEEYHQLSQDPELWHSRRGGFRVMEVLGAYLRQAYDVLASLAGPESVVAASTLGFAARILHETHGTPLASVHLSPFVFRSLHDPPRLPGMIPLGWMPRLLLQRFWDGADRYVLDPAVGRPINKLRAELGLTVPVSKVLDAWWHAPQRVIALWPEWFAPPPPDWPRQAVYCGFPLYDERDTADVPAELEPFLASGEAPIAFTPGSAMMFGQRFFRAAVEACQRLGMRGLLLSRSAHHIPADLPPGVRYVPFAPFSRILPRCRALVHHGGIGTLSQALAAGVPQLVMPMAHDQWDNAARLKRLGVGASLLPRFFTGRRLAAKLRNLLLGPGARATTARCQALAAQIHEGEALERACDLLERLAESPNVSNRSPVTAGETPLERHHAPV